MPLLTGIDSDTDAIKTATEACATDLAAIELLLTSANTDHAGNKSHLNTIAGDTTSIDGKITACDTGSVVLAAGTVTIGKLAANDGVDIGDVDVTSIIPGTGATNLGKAEDSPHASGDVGVMALAVRDDNGNYINSSHNGDYYPLTVDAGGKLRCVMTTSTALNVIIGEGSSVIGKLAANDDVDIGDVSVKAKDGSGNEKHIVCDTDGHLQVDVLSVPTTTITGTVTANLSTTDNTVLDNILTKITANETLLTAANIDHAANEALLTGIDSDTDAIKTATEACATDLAAIELLLLQQIQITQEINPILIQSQVILLL